MRVGTRYAAGAVVVGFMVLACGGFGASDGEIGEALDAIEPTQSDGGAMIMSLDGAGAPPMDSGSGLQVLQVAPLGTGRKSLQAAVVFDKPMVALSDLDSMTQSVPLRCAPKIEARIRWAGTSTAVLMPAEKSFPLATAFTCTVPKGTTSLDGTALENEIEWTFETERPVVKSSTLHNGSNDVEPNAPFTVSFNQPVKSSDVEKYITLRFPGGDIPIRVKSVDDEPERLEIVPVGGMVSDEQYSLEIAAGFNSALGPLPAKNAWKIEFRTYPPLKIVSFEPKGSPEPLTDISVQFSTRVSQEVASKYISVSPAPVDDWEPPSGTWKSTHWSYYLRLNPQTEYTVTFAAGLVDTYGQELTPKKFKFKTGDFRPWMDVSTGFKIYASNNPKTLPIRHLNTKSVDVKMAAVDFDTYRSQSSWTDAQRASLSSGTEVDILVDGQDNVTEVDELDLRPFLEDGHGLVTWTASSPEVRERYGDNDKRVFNGMALVTDLGATLKVSPGHMEAWVTSLTTGRPVEGAEVRFYRGPNEILSGTTNGDGFVEVDGQPLADWKSWKGDERMWVVAQKGSDWTVADHNWNDKIRPWRFNIGESWNSRGSSWVSHGFADRGVYRLGDPAYARVTWRAQTAKGLEIPKGKVKWWLTDPRGSKVEEGTGALDARGGFDVKVQVPEDGALGDYYLRFEASNGDVTRTHGVSIPARAYRAPSFRVSVNGPESAIAGEQIEAHVDARYLFGAPMNAANVEWSSWRTARWFHPEAWEGWSFGPEYRWWESDQHGGGGILASGNGETADGAFAVTVEGPKDESLRPQTLHIEARVRNADRQVVASSAEVLVHPAAWYAGLRATERIPSATEETAVDVIAVSPEGEVQSGQSLEVEVVRRTWDRVREKGMDGRWEYVNTPVDETLHSETVKTGSSPKSVAFTPEKAGYYVVTAKGADADGNEVSATETMYVTGSGYTPWALTDDQRMELVPNKRTYHPGDVAKILVKSPREGLSALVTVEREGVLWRQIVTLESTASTVEIPIDEDWRPNVYVSVLAVEGAGPQLSPDAGKPQVDLGMVALEIDAKAEHMQVSISTERDDYRPRDKVTAAVKVEREGKPVGGAGVTLYAVDEAILSLTAYQTPDSHGTFYRHHGLSVLTGDTRVRILDRAAYLTKGAPPGGGGGMEASGPEMRTKFLTTVTWQPDLQTGPDGTVEATFDLPDNLTAFRIMAVVDAGAKSFGSAEREIRVNRPIVLKPALPRFLRTEDTAFAGVVVHNNSEEPRDVYVEATVDGPVELTGSPSSIFMEAGEAKEVAFQLKGQEIGDAKFTFKASSGPDRDAIEWSIPIQRKLAFDVAATAGTTTTVAEEQIARPDNALTAFGGLDVDLATTVLVGAGSGLEYVLDYPHGCAEQITSRGMASLEAIPIREAAGISVAEADLKSNVEGALRQLSRFQHSSGGASYWPGSHYVSVMGTAYVVEFMGRSKESGFEVDDKQLEAHARFLREVLNGKHMTKWDPLVSLSARAYVAVALARAGHGDAGHNSKIYEQRRDLSILGTASVLEAIARTTGADTRTGELAQTIASRAYIEPTSASIKENTGSRWSRLWGSDDLSTAASLEALIFLGGEHVLAPKLATHLAGSRVHGRWHNTRATAGVFAALSAYSKAYESPGDEIQITANLAGDELLHASRRIPESVQLRIDMADLKNGPLKLTSGGGRMYYEARLRYVPKKVEARDEGFTVVRNIEVVDGDGDGVIEGGELLRVTIRVVTPVVRHDVAIVDPLPAGLEAVNNSFATTSRAPVQAPPPSSGTAELPEYGGSWVFDHSEIADDEVRLYADYMPPGIHIYRYVARATTPGSYDHPPATAEEMYEPENFGRTAAGRFTVGAGDEEVASQ